MEAPLVDELGKRLGIAFRDPELVQQAFVHSSFLNENPGVAAGHNERLEFYGDAVIGLVVSRLLYDRYPDEDEGFLTARRAALVNREALAVMALDLGFDQFLLLGRGESDGGGATRPSLLAASFEAVAGALSLSETPATTMEVLSALFEPRLQALAGVNGPPKSAKSRLQEWSQRQHGTKPSYRLVRTSGPPHEQVFDVSVFLAGLAVASGTGSSRQRAEEAAARDALGIVGADGPADPA
jgi:ribonuclease-3